MLFVKKKTNFKRITFMQHKLIGHSTQAMFGWISVHQSDFQRVFSQYWLLEHWPSFFSGLELSLLSSNGKKWTWVSKPYVILKYPTTLPVIRKFRRINKLHLWKHGRSRFTISSSYFICHFESRKQDTKSSPLTAHWRIGHSSLVIKGLSFKVMLS